MSSPWIKVPSNSIKGLCMLFTYRLLEKHSKLGVVVEPKNMKKEELWQISNHHQKNTIWRIGQVSLGLVTEFRVSEVLLRTLAFSVGFSTYFDKCNYYIPIVKVLLSI